MICLKVFLHNLYIPVYSYVPVVVFMYNHVVACIFMCWDNPYHPGREFVLNELAHTADMGSTIYRYISIMCVTCTLITCMLIYLFSAIFPMLRYLNTPFAFKNNLTKL